MVEQCNDGMSTMSGVFNGVQTVIRRQLPAASYVHCASHYLNLTLSTACKQPQIRNAYGVVGEVAAFFNRSATWTATRLLLFSHIRVSGRRTC